VADILEGFGAVLATDIEEDFLTTTRCYVSNFRSGVISGRGDGGIGGGVVQ
jgi:hypothetical protein